MAGRETGFCGTLGLPKVYMDPGAGANVGHGVMRRGLLHGIVLIPASAHKYGKTKGQASL